MKKRVFVSVFFAALGTALTNKFIKNVKQALTMRLVNASGKTLHCMIGSDDEPDVISVMNFQPGEERTVDLRDIPLGPHTAVYIRFLDEQGQDLFRRTLVYDIAEAERKMEALLVDYGSGSVDVKMV